MLKERLAQQQVRAGCILALNVLRFQGAEKDALAILRRAPDIGSLAFRASSNVVLSTGSVFAMDLATEMLLDKLEAGLTHEEETQRDRLRSLRSQCFLLGQDLFQSVGMKFSVALYKAVRAGDEITIL